MRRRVDLALLLGFCWTLLSSAATAAEDEWRVLALRVDFVRESPDELTTTGVGAFDLRSAEEAAAEYALPYDLPPHDRAYFERHLTALARYYEVVSEGQVAISAEVFPRAMRQAYSLPQPMLHYGNGRTTEEIGAKWIELLRDALAATLADPNGPRLDEFNSFLVFHAGVGYETGQLNDIRSVFLSESDFARFNGGPLTVGDAEIAQAWILPESPSLNGRAGLNGLLAKFFGHQLGLPGLSNFADGLPALGGWSLMDVGANASGYVRTDSLAWVVGFAPPHPMAWSKMQLGWIEPVVVRRDTVLSLLATDRSGDLPKAVRIPIDAREYFLLENRQQRGQRGGAEDEGKVWIDPEQVAIDEGVWVAMEEYDAFVPGSGVLIWHLDEGVMARAADPSAVNNQPQWPGIALEEADGYRDIGNPRRAWERQVEGGADDPFFIGGQTLFGPATRPDSRSNREWATGIEIEVLSAPGDTMQVAICFGRVRPGWPRDLPGDGRLQAADLDGDGVDELLFEAGGGVGYAGGGEVASWRVPGARLLAAGDGVIFLRRDAEVSAWDAGADQPRWQRTLDEVPLDARFSGGEEAALLLAGADQTYAIDALSGELKERRPPGDAPSDGRFGRRWSSRTGCRHSRRAGRDRLARRRVGRLARCAAGLGRFGWRWPVGGGFAGARRRDTRPASGWIAPSRLSRCPAALCRGRRSRLRAGARRCGCRWQAGDLRRRSQRNFRLRGRWAALAGLPLADGRSPDGVARDMELRRRWPLGASRLGWRSRVCVGFAAGGGPVRGRPGPLAAGGSRRGRVADRAGRGPPGRTVRGGVANPGLLLSQSSRPRGGGPFAL